MKAITLLLSVLVLNTVYAQDVPLPKWEQGILDIHHINTGRGNASFIVFPDGTNLLVDAGDFNREVFDTNYAPMKSPPIRPDSSWSAGKAILNYIQQIYERPIQKIDYALITHYHSDHYGSVRPETAKSRKGSYYLTGITEIGDLLPISNLIDRNYPQMDYPVDLRNNPKSNGGIEPETMENYLLFIKEQEKISGMHTQSLKAGSNTQIVMQKEIQNLPKFEVRNIKANQMIWTGNGNTAKPLFDKSIWKKTNGNFNDNQLSLALLFRYGKFDYFLGGDNSGLEDQDHEKWFDLETPMAKVIGKIEALSLNHHGNRDATNVNFLNTLDPKVVVAQSWSPDHPGQEVGNRLISSNIGSQRRAIFMTYYHPETSVGIGPWFSRELKPKQGHILIRVQADGSYKVYVLDDTKTNLSIIADYGTYTSR